MSEQLAGPPPQYEERIEKIEQFYPKAIAALREKAKDIATDFLGVYIPGSESIGIARLNAEEKYIVLLAIGIASKKTVYVITREELIAYKAEDVTDEQIEKLKQAAREFAASYKDWPLLD